MTRPLLLAALMALSLNAYAVNMLSPFSPLAPFSIYKQTYKTNHKDDEIKTHKCQVVQPTKTPCKAPCCVCTKNGKPVPCEK